MLLGSCLPPHLSGASPTTFYCGNMVWQNIMESGKKIYEQKKQQQPVEEEEEDNTTTPLVGTVSVVSPCYTELHGVAFGSNERMVMENATFDNINRRDHNGNTPLMWAVSQGNEQLVEALVDQGALVNMQNFVGETALFVAAARGFDKICALLMESGGDSRLATVEGATAVHIAAASGHLEVLRLLASRGAFINSVDEEGDCVLHYAVREGQFPAIQLLVKHFGADFTIKNEDLETPLDLAIELGENAIADFLTKFNGNAIATDLSEHPLYFGEDDMQMDKLPKKEQQAQASKFGGGARSVPVY